jgi:hypothetical protein
MVCFMPRKRAVCRAMSNLLHVRRTTCVRSGVEYLLRMDNGRRWFLSLFLFLWIILNSGSSRDDEGRVFDDLETTYLVSNGSYYAPDSNDSTRLHGGERKRDPSLLPQPAPKDARVMAVRGTDRIEAKTPRGQSGGWVLGRRTRGGRSCSRSCDGTYCRAG